MLWCVKRIQERRTATGRAAGRPFVFSQKIRTWIEEMGVDFRVISKVQSVALCP